MKKFKIPNSEIELQLIDIKGKDYLKVAQRLIWFNFEKSDWSIDTEVEQDTGDMVRFKCTIKDPTGRLLRTARKTKLVNSDKDYDSCETGSIGRCLGLLGYGTQYCGEDLDEGEVVDAPQELKSKQAFVEQAKVLAKQMDVVTESPPEKPWEPKTETVKNITMPNVSAGSIPFPDQFIIKQKKYKGKTLSEVGKNNLESYIAFIRDLADQRNEPVGKGIEELEAAMRAKWPKDMPRASQDGEPPITAYDEEIPF